MKTTAVVLTLSIAFVGALVVFARPAQEAADSNNAIYKQLVAGGVNRDVAAAMTASTEIIAQDDQQLHYRQTMPGGETRRQRDAHADADSKGPGRPDCPG